MSNVEIILSTDNYECTAEEYYYNPYNVTRTTVSGIAAYRSALTLDWLAAEDSRQRELAAAFETEAAPPSRILATECIAYPRPSSGKIARLVLELLKNLEGDDAKLVPDLIQALFRSKMLVETSILDAEPDLDALVKTPGVMMGEPHVTFPRIMAMIWMTVTDPITTKKFGWCSITKVNKYLSASKSSVIAKHMRALEPIVARARFIMEEFIQNITPINIYQKKTTKQITAPPKRTSRKKEKKPNQPIDSFPDTKIEEVEEFASMSTWPKEISESKPIELPKVEKRRLMENVIVNVTERTVESIPRLLGPTMIVPNSSNVFYIYKILFIVSVCVLQ